MNSCTATGSPREPMPAERSSRGPTDTTNTGSTRASTTGHPSNGNSYTVNPEPTKPRNQRDRSTGEPQFHLNDPCAVVDAASPVTGIESESGRASDPFGE